MRKAVLIIASLFLLLLGATFVLHSRFSTPRANAEKTGENALTYYQQAISRMKATSKNYDELSLDEKRAFLKSNEEMFAALKKGAACEYSPVTLEGGEPYNDMMALPLTNMLLIRGRMQAHDGNYAGAMQGVLDTIKLCLDLRKNYAVEDDRLSTRTQTEAFLDAWGYTAKLTDEESRTVLKRLNDLLAGASFDYAQAIQNDKEKLVSESFGPNWRPGLKEFAEGLKKDIETLDKATLEQARKETGMPMTAPWINNLLTALDTMKDEEVIAHVNSVFDQLAQTARLSYPTLRTTKLPELIYGDIITEFFFSNINIGDGPFSHENVARQIFQEAFLKAQYGLLSTQIALEAYKKDKGQDPPTLAQLTPVYLPAHPKDPFTAGTLIYLPKSDGYTLYSAGPDGKDDQGKPITGKNNDRKTTPDSLGDIVAGVNKG